MRLPVIKHIRSFVVENDQDFLEEAIEVLEHLSESSAIKDEELDVIGELISNMHGALEVSQMVADGDSEKDALNKFMKRVTGSIDT
ncbi:MAG TPA: hypothetical protein VJ911_02785 [Cryomorphaceae bacterium]|nr:hypothetical protein [Cryomorphaceae bacterium]